MEFHSKASFVVVEATQSPFFLWLLTLSPGEGGWEKSMYHIALGVSPSHAHAG